MPRTNGVMLLLIAPFNFIGLLSGVATAAPCSATKITGADAGAHSAFGAAVAAAGEYLVIAAPSPANASIHVWRKSGSGWAEETEFTAPDGPVNDGFGASVAIDTDTLVVGAPLDDELGAASGSAYVFRRTETGWVQEARLTASTGEAEDMFGRTVAVSGHLLVITAMGDDDGGEGSGAAYVFRRAGSNWSQEAKLTATAATAGARFGYSAAIDGDRVIVGADVAAAAYVYRRESGNWIEEKRLVGISDPNPKTAFGNAVAIHGDVLAVSALHEGIHEGWVYVYDRMGTDWTLRNHFTSADAQPLAHFGWSLALRGPHMVVGASYAGRTAHILTDLGAGFVEEAKLTSSDPSAGDDYASVVALSESHVVVGAGRDSDGGAAYVYKLATCATTIPTLTEWGLFTLAVLLLAAGSVMTTRRRARSA